MKFDEDDSFSFWIGAIIGGMLAFAFTDTINRLTIGRELCDCCGSRRPEATVPYICDECKQKVHKNSEKE